jgi:hypothetical protein
VLDVRVPSDGPFVHDRKKTFQPQDLWQWLLRWAILLFPIDVGIRRIQIDRAEWSRAAAALRKWLFFWRGPQRQAEAEESLAALLSRRDQVRAQRQTERREAPDPRLFQPSKPPELPPSASVGNESRRPVMTPPEASPEAEESTTSRLLEAKRRARRR